MLIKVSAMLMLMRGESRVSTVSVFYWLYCLKVVIKVKDIVFYKLTILYLLNHWVLDYDIQNESCKVSRVH